MIFVYYLLITIFSYDNTNIYIYIYIYILITSNSFNNYIIMIYFVKGYHKFGIDTNFLFIN